MHAIAACLYHLMPRCSNSTATLSMLCRLRLRWMHWEILGFEAFEWGGVGTCSDWHHLASEFSILPLFSPPNIHPFITVPGDVLTKSWMLTAFCSAILYEETGWALDHWCFVKGGLFKTSYAPHIFKSLQILQMENINDYLSFLSNSLATHFQINPKVFCLQNTVRWPSIERSDHGRTKLCRESCQYLGSGSPSPPGGAVGFCLGRDLRCQQHPKRTKKHPKTINGSTEYIIYIYIIELAWWIYSSFSLFLTRPSFSNCVTSERHGSSGVEEEGMLGAWGSAPEGEPQIWWRSARESLESTWRRSEDAQNGHFTVLGNDPLDTSWGISYIELPVKHGHFPWPW